MNNKNLSNLFNGIFVTGLANFISNVSLFLLMVYLAKVLDLNEFGVISFVIAISNISIAFGDFGTSLALQKYVQDVPQNETGNVIVSSIILKIIASLIIGFMIFILDYYTNVFKMYGFYISLIIIGSSFGLVVNIYNAQLEFKKARMVQILFNLSYIILAVGLIYLNFRVTGPLIAKAVGVMIIGLPLTLYFILTLKAKLTKKTFIKIFQYGGMATLLALLSMIFTQSDIILLTYMKGEDFAGIYKVAMTLSSLVLIFGTVISTPLFPILSQQIKNDNIKEIFKINKIITRYIVFFAIPIFIGGTILAQTLIEFIFSVKFITATKPFILLLLSQVLGIIVISMGSILRMNNKLNLLVYISFLTASLNIIGNILLIPSYDLAGAAFSSLFSFIIGFWLQYMWFKRNMPLLWEWERYFKFLISSVIMGSFIYVALPFIINIIVLVFTIIISAIIYLIVVFVLKGINLNELKCLKNMVSRGNH
ncbi:flippase [Candidatus Pacearchaeota archaeon]|nr:flippase [Candidatus Pacearchaeota archaeon]